MLHAATSIAFTELHRQLVAGCHFLDNESGWCCDLRVFDPERYDF